MCKDFTKKRVNFGSVLAKQRHIEQMKGIAHCETENLAYYVEYLLISDERLDDFIMLVNEMVENDKEFEIWKKNIEYEKPMAVIKEEISIYQNKFNEIDRKMYRIAQIDIYTSYCNYPSITL